MSVGRICTRHVDLAEVGENARVAAERMRQRCVGSLVVLDDSRQPVGIVTDRDLVLRLLAAGRDPLETSVEEVMTPRPTTVSEDTAIEDAVDLMRRGSFRRLPVVDGGGKLVGLVTLDDVLGLLAEEFVSVGKLLKRESPGSGAAR